MTCPRSSSNARTTGYDLDVVAKEMEDRQRLAVTHTLGEMVKGYRDYFKSGLEFMEECSVKMEQLSASVLVVVSVFESV
jgi:hypothetical protein